MEKHFKLNNYFDKIYCFCKPSNYKNWNVYKNLYEFYNIDVKLIPAEDIDSRVTNNVYNSWKNRELLSDNINIQFIADSLSHTTFINHAIDNKYNTILILKENVIPFKEYNDILSKLEIKKEWDFLIFKNQNEVIGYGVKSFFYDDLLKLIKEFKLSFDEIINEFICNKNYFEINSSLFFIYNKSYLNNNFISLNSLLYNKDIYFILYPFNEITFIEKNDFELFSIYNQYDYFNWKFNFDDFILNIYETLFTNKKILFIGNSFCLKINEILSYFNDSKFFVIKENLETINNINEYKFYPELIAKDDQFIKNYFNFYYDYIDSISYKIKNIEFIEINNFKIKELL